MDNEMDTDTAAPVTLRNRPTVNVSVDSSDTVYIRGFPGSETDEDILRFLSKVEPPVEIDLSLRISTGQVWAKYSTLDVAWGTISALHQANVKGSVLSAKYELGVDSAGKRIVDRSSHSTIIRSIGLRKEGLSRQKVAKSLKRPLHKTGALICSVVGSSGDTCDCATCNNGNSNVQPGKKKNQPTNSPSEGVSYTSNSICVGETEYPFPSGVYLTRVIELSHKLHLHAQHTAAGQHNESTQAQVSLRTDPLLDILLDTKCHGNKYGKEISEAMAMVDAVQRAISLLPPSYRHLVSGTSAGNSHGDVSVSASVSGAAKCAANPECEPVGNSAEDIVRVYVLGDGKQPLSAAAACLHLPAYFQYYSVDPIMAEQYQCEVQNGGDTCTTEPIGDKVTDSPKSVVQKIVGNANFGQYSDSFFPVAMMSQDFVVPPLISASTKCCAMDTSKADPVTSECGPPRCVFSIIVSCHSHAPLQEFWDRVCGPKVAVTMACCAGYADLFETQTNADGGASVTKVPLKPMINFNDYEVYSPKRNVKIYFSP